MVHPGNFLPQGGGRIVAALKVHPVGWSRKDPAVLATSGKQGTRVSADHAGGYGIAGKGLTRRYGLAIDRRRDATRTVRKLNRCRHIGRIGGNAGFSVIRRRKHCTCSSAARVRIFTG